MLSFLLLLPFFAHTIDDCLDINTFCVGASEAYTTIQDAIDAVSGGGQKILIKSDTYDEALKINCIMGTAPGTSESDNIEMRPYDQDSVVLTVTGGFEPLIYYFGCNFWHIHEGEGSLTIRAGTSLSQSVHINIDGMRHFGPFDVICDDNARCSDVDYSSIYMSEMAIADGVLFNGIRFVGSTLANNAHVALHFNTQIGGPPPSSYPSEYDDPFSVLVKNCVFSPTDGVVIAIEKLYNSYFDSNYFEFEGQGPATSAFHIGNLRSLNTQTSDIFIQNNVISFARNDADTNGVIHIGEAGMALLHTNIFIQNNLVDCGTRSVDSPMVVFAPGLSMIADVSIFNNAFLGNCGFPSGSVILANIDLCSNCQITSNTAVINQIDWFTGVDMGWIDLEKPGRYLLPHTESGDKPYPFYQATGEGINWSGDALVTSSTPTRDFNGVPRDRPLGYYVGPFIPEEVMCNGLWTVPSCSVCSLTRALDCNDRGEPNCDTDVCLCDQGDSTGDFCEVCGVGWYETSVGSPCEKCPEHTSTGMPGARSIADCMCIAGYYLDMFCQMCKIGTWKSVIGDGDCTQCDPGWTTSVQGWTGPGCDVQCPAFCDHCESDTLCTECMGGFYLHEGSCVMICPPGYYEDNFPPRQCSECTNIHDRCIDCMDFITCVDCEYPGWRVDEFGSCEQCADPNCADCFVDPIICEECVPMTYLFIDTMQCVIDCASKGPYFNDDLTLPPTCMECDDGCAACWAEMMCYECEPTHYADIDDFCQCCDDGGWVPDGFGDCEQCPPDSVAQPCVDAECIQCTGGFIPNAEQTLCIPITCSNCEPGSCIGPSHCLKCEEGWYPPPLCDKPNVYCGNYRASEPEVCNGGECVSEECLTCIDPWINGPLVLCEDWHCGGKSFRDTENVCGGKGNCLLEGLQTRCECYDDDENGHWIDSLDGSPCARCDGAWKGSECLTPVLECIHGTYDPVLDACECEQSLATGFFDGQFCERCVEDYYPNDDSNDACKTHCIVLTSDGIPSGQCNELGEVEACYSDFQRGFFQSSGGGDCNVCMDHTYQGNRFHIEGSQCVFGFYAPSSDWFIMDTYDSDELHLNKVFFSEDYASVFGYFSSPADFSGLCEDFIWPKDIIGDSCTLEIVSSASERVFGSGLATSVGETVSTMIISGLKNVRIGSTFSIDIGQMERLFLGVSNRRGTSQLTKIDITIVQLQASQTTFAIKYDSPPPLLKSVRAPNFIRMCPSEDDGSVLIRVFAENKGDGSLHNLWFTAVLDDPGSATFNQDVESLYVEEEIDGVTFRGIPIVEELELGVDSFKPGTNSITFTVMNIHEKDDEMTIEIENSSEEFLEVWVEGSKYYVFQNADLDKALGSLVVRLYKCGGPLVGEELASLRTEVVQISGPPITMELPHVDWTDPRKIDFYYEAFSVFNEQYELEVRSYLGEPPNEVLATDQVIIYPDAGDLVVVGIKSVQAYFPSDVLIDLSASYDPVGDYSVEDSEVFWSCSPGCSLAIFQEDDFVVSLRPGENEPYLIPGPDTYDISFTWLKGNRIAESHIFVTYQEKDFTGFNFVESFEAKKFCLNGVNFENEYFYFYLDRSKIGDPSFMYYFDNLYVDVRITLENSEGSHGPISYFEDEPAFYVDTANNVRHFENRIGLITVYHDPGMTDREHQIVLQIHYNYFREMLYPGDNVLTVSLEIESPEEVIIGAKSSSFVIHPILHDEAILSSLIISKYGRIDPNQEFESCVAGVCTVTWNQKIYTLFDFDDSMFDLEYYYKVMRMEFLPEKFEGDEGYFYEIASEKVEERIHNIDYNQPWAELWFGEILPFVFADESSVVYGSIEGKEKLIEGSEVVRIRSKSTGCVSEFNKDHIKWNELNNDIWMYDEDTTPSTQRRKVELTFDQSPPWDVSPRTIPQQLAVKHKEMYDIEMMTNLAGDDIDAFVGYVVAMDDVFQPTFLTVKRNPEMPTISSYAVDLRIIETYTRVISALDQTKIKELVNDGTISLLVTFMGILVHLEEKMIYHLQHPDLKLLPNTNLNLVFNAVSNIKHCAAILEPELNDIVEDADRVKSLFVSIMMNVNVDNYDEEVAMGDGTDYALDLFHSKTLSNSEMYALKNSNTQVKLEKEGSTKIAVGESKFDAKFTSFHLTSEEDELGRHSDLVSSFVSVVSNNENKYLHSLSVQFDMSGKLENVMSSSLIRRGSGVKPYCFRYDPENEYWEEKEAGNDCIGVSEFYSITGGEVYCTWNDVQYDGVFTTVVESYPGCMKRSSCPVEVLYCSDFVQQNAPKLTTSTSKRVHVSEGFFKSLFKYNDDDSTSNSNRREEDDNNNNNVYETVKSICVNEHVSVIVDSNFELWMMGSSEMNDYLQEDAFEPVQISLVDWDGYQPTKCVATASSVFCLAYNPDVTVKTSRVFAFGRNGDLEIGQVNTKFEVFADDVLDVQSSKHSVYVTMKSKDANGKYVIRARGMNHHGCLATNNIAFYSNSLEYVILEEFPADVVPEVIPMEDSVMFKFKVANDPPAWKFYYAGKSHPQTYIDERIPVLFNLTDFRRLDFVQRLYGGGPMYFISEGKFWVSGDESTSGLGIDPNLVHIIHPHEFHAYQMGDFDESCDRILDFTCAFSCYLVCVNSEKEVITYVWGKSTADTSFDATCNPSGICDRITEASRTLIGVFPGWGERTYHEEGLDEQYDVVFFEKPVKMNVMSPEETYLFPPEIVYDQSFMNNDVLTLTLRKPFILGEAESEIRFVLKDKLEFSEHAHDVYIGEDNCIFPFYQNSHWNFWNEDEGDSSWDYYQISMPWFEFSDSCGWRYDSSSEDYDLYENRLLFVANTYFGRSKGQFLSRREDFLFDFYVRFPKKVLKTSVSIKQGEFEWRAHVVDKSFDRVSRNGYIRIQTTAKNPNYFVLYDNIVNPEDLVNEEESSNSVHYPVERIKVESQNDDDDIANFFLPDKFGVEEIPVEANDVGDWSSLCNEKYCFQTFQVEFQLIRDSRVCHVPRATLRVNFVQFCHDENSADCVKSNEAIVFEIDLEVDNLCWGEFIENIETTFSLKVFEDWTYQNEYPETHVFSINDWLYIRASVESHKVTIVDTAIDEISFFGPTTSHSLLYSFDEGVQVIGDVVRLVVDDLGSFTMIGFHFILHNELTVLQPAEKEDFELVVKLRVTYLGNEHAVISRRQQAEKATDEEVVVDQVIAQAIVINVVHTGSASSFSILPYLLTLVTLAVVFLSFVLFIVCILFVAVKGKKLGNHLSMKENV